MDLSDESRLGTYSSGPQTRFHVNMGVANPAISLIIEICDGFNE